MAKAIKTPATKKAPTEAPPRVAVITRSAGTYTAWSSTRRIAAGPTFDRAAKLAARRGYTIVSSLA